MDTIDYTAWSVDLSTCTATHSSGFSIKFDGRPGRNFNGSPRNWPKDLGALEKVRLLRFGYDAYRHATGHKED
jgi:hypothetical protein